MTTVTITLEEEVSQWAHQWAKTHSASLSQLIGELLQQRMFKEPDYDHAMKQYLWQSPGSLKKGGNYPSQEEHDDRNPILLDSWLGSMAKTGKILGDIVAPTESSPSEWEVLK
jgi:hypothetical protein